MIFAEVFLCYFIREHPNFLLIKNSDAVHILVQHNVEQVRVIESRLGHLPELVGEAGRFYFGDDVWDFLEEARELPAFLGSGGKVPVRLGIGEGSDFKNSGFPENSPVLLFSFRNPTNRRSWRGLSLAYKAENEDWKYFVGEGQEEWREVPNIIELRNESYKAWDNWGNKNSK